MENLVLLRIADGPRLRRNDRVLALLSRNNDLIKLPWLKDWFIVTIFYINNSSIEVRQILYHSRFIVAHADQPSLLSLPVREGWQVPGQAFELDLRWRHLDVSPKRRVAKTLVRQRQEHIFLFAGILHAMLLLHLQLVYLRHRR